MPVAPPHKGKCRAFSRRSSPARRRGFRSRYFMKDKEAAFTQYLRRSGRKLTGERRRIADAALSFHGHFDIEDLFERLKRKGSRISRATIYRTIPLLVRSGMIKEAMRCQGRVLYEPRHGHHDHLVCVKCGRVIEFRDDRIERLQDSVCRRYGFTPLEHRLGIRGYCRNCQAAAGGSAGGKGR